MEDLAPRPLEQGRRDHGDRTVRPHAPGIRSGVSLEQALVVLGDGQELDLAAIRYRQDRDFLALEKRLDDHRRPRLAERAVAEHRAHGRGGLRAGRAHDRALARGETRRLHHQRLRVPVHVGERRLQLVEGAAGGGRDSGRGHHVLGERFGRLDLGGGGTGAEHRASLGAEPVGEPTRERHLGSDHGEVDPVHVRRIGDAVEVVRGDGEVGGELGGTRIPGRAVEVGVGLLPPQRPAEGVLAPAAADDQQPHDFCAFRKASRARSAARRAASATWEASSRASPA